MSDADKKFGRKATDREKCLEEIEALEKIISSKMDRGEYHEDERDKFSDLLTQAITKGWVTQDDAKKIYKNIQRDPV